MEIHIGLWLGVASLLCLFSAMGQARYLKQKLSECRETVAGYLPWRRNATQTSSSSAHNLESGRGSERPSSLLELAQALPHMPCSSAIRPSVGLNCSTTFIIALMQMCLVKELPADWMPLPLLALLLILVFLFFLEWVASAPFVEIDNTCLNRIKATYAVLLLPTVLLAVGIVVAHLINMIQSGKNKNQ